MWNVNEFHVETCVSFPRYLIMCMQIFQNKKNYELWSISYCKHFGWGVILCLGLSCKELPVATPGNVGLFSKQSWKCMARWAPGGGDKKTKQGTCVDHIKTSDQVRKPMHYCAYHQMLGGRIRPEFRSFCLHTTLSSLCSSLNLSFPQIIKPPSNTHIRMHSFLHPLPHRTIHPGFDSHLQEPDKEFALASHHKTYKLVINTSSFLS